MGKGPAISGTLTRLVPTSEDDLDLLAGWFADPGFVEHWGGVPVSREEVAAKYVGRRRPEVESFLVLAQEAPVGYAQYWYAGAVAGGLDMVLVSGARGRGLGPDAARALVSHVCGTLGWRRVTVDPAATNPRAVRAWEKAGFSRVPGDGGEPVAGVPPRGRLLLRPTASPWATGEQTGTVDPECLRASVTDRNPGVPCASERTSSLGGGSTRSAQQRAGAARTGDGGMTHAGMVRGRRQFARVVEVTSCRYSRWHGLQRQGVL